MRSRLTGFMLSMAVLLIAASPAYPQYGGGDYDPFTIRSSTIQEGVQRGAADVLRSQGLAAKLNAEAAVTFGRAAQQAMENRRAAIEGYYDTRRRAKELRMADRGPRPDAETLARLARNGRPDPLSPSELDPITGRVNWPVLLRFEAFAEARAGIERLFEHRADTQRLDAEEYLKVRELSEAMETKLKDRVRELPLTEYSRARQFLSSVAYEAAKPAEPAPALAMQP